MEQLKKKIQALSKEYLSDIKAIRRHLHQHPELSFKEYETSKYVQSQLQKMGIPFETGFVETGVVGLIKGQNPESKTIALRGDMDALPIFETNTTDYVSRNKGVMHACGHDVHTSCLLGAARILVDTKDDWQGTIKLIFQPGEEKIPGGASLMIKEGVLENPKPQRVFGQHVYPELEAGKIGMKPGMYMASADEVYLTIKGKGGHAALPHKLVDPILMSAHILSTLQHIVSRNAQPDIPAVLSFGKIEGYGATNIIPDDVKIEGTFRTMNEPMREKLHDRIEATAKSVANSFGGECEVEIRKGYPYLVNDEATTLKAKSDAMDYMGPENVVDLNLRMTAEDFAYFSHEVPGCFYRLGVAAEGKAPGPGLHTSNFDVDEKSLETGMGLLAWLAVNAEG